MRHAALETEGRELAKRGAWASWTAQALFAWTRTHDEPGKSETCGNIAAGVLRSGVKFWHRAPARLWTVGTKASHGNGRLLDACFRVFARCAKKKIFNFFTSFSGRKWFNFQRQLSVPLTIIFRALLAYLESLLPTNLRAINRQCQVMSTSQYFDLSAFLLRSLSLKTNCRES